ncbi:MAG: type II toxin-antitoxin system PemK/MazF family toxin [Bacteroidales bacterium]|nr:type II toxin-antitoxin system PemK/MazF family toxin [Bacteroidales bacterium]MCF8343582.1 type II toxin-antitoxin system PemK/MazF family toxin [Bacteroidales bacterium]MCF8350238.1 type II toxin-antitoxin system PemK/MazF family toxin [Bacteroidales bacterium]MCF8375817.1 type II toxin-antitoxin system PemK/MazF family toxin [Bacteroidales bacterium]MCF8401743.1 type II toxin-antitoxin system PemK/MazF family toxin [Bacteroidales bacterium]
MKYKKWSIWRANLDPVIGSEQGKSRPVLIISEDDVNDLLSIINIIPITSRKFDRTIYPNEAFLPGNKFGLENDSIALCHQIRTIDRRRLSKRYGKISEEDIRKKIVEALCFQLGINPG